MTEADASFVGQRGGWVPMPHEIKDDEDRKLWAGRYVTDMEIRHAVFNRRVRRRSNFYLRETFVPEPPRTDPAIYGEFVDTDSAEVNRLTDVGVAGALACQVAGG